MSRLFAFWTGDNPFCAKRQRGWDSFGVTGLEPILVTPATLDQWVAPDRPLHPAYPYLSLVHRSDYLRPYFMHHHGGGYADIKPQPGSWLGVVDRVERSSRLLGAGYREIRGGSVRLQRAPIKDKCYILSHAVPCRVAKLATDTMRAARPLLIGNGAYYFKPRTAFTKAWLTEVERRLELVLDDLRRVKTPDIRARLGDDNGYPLPWSSIHGDVLQPLAFRNFARLDRGLPRPSFIDYR